MNPTSTSSNTPVTVLFNFLLLPLLVKSESLVTAETSIALSNEAFILSIVVSAAVFLVLCSVVLFLCGDCYNSEVSSSTHPACGGSKWGGSDGYHGTISQDVNMSVMQSSHTLGDVVGPSTQGLPYAMMPSQVQTQHQFVGYKSTSGTNTAAYSGGGELHVNSYAGGGSQNVGGSQRGEEMGMHFNPLDNLSEEQPPSYNEVVRTGR